MKDDLRRSLPLLLLSIVMLTAVAGCKLYTPSIPKPTATNAIVRITLQNAKFGVSEPLGVLIKNTASADVYALNGKAACTILSLQRYDDQKKTWVLVDRCHDTVPPKALVIHAGMSEPFTLAPSSASDPNAWASGLYRVALTFSTHPDGKSTPQVAYSPGFVISNT